VSYAQKRVAVLAGAGRADSDQWWVKMRGAGPSLDRVLWCDLLRAGHRVHSQGQNSGWAMALPSPILYKLKTHLRWQHSLVEGLTPIGEYNREVLNFGVTWPTDI